MVLCMVLCCARLHVWEAIRSAPLLVPFLPALRELNRVSSFYGSRLTLWCN
ncbi:hypothetical protein M758_6G121700 [Ceratodon purpureus]|uniref:Uncharacterized protein n=1 Tax=Ceratodon purpureus TaxID=3225 RepID=A0A8T0HED0_CERPU|nr:hypothetical protein KC19_6G126300 [Ceratodon purpureus]KAG0613684.1 hypothetical protein M758_6G121700 [Ceratodon purpureus]